MHAQPAAAPASTAASAASAPAVRWFGRLQLLKLLGKSDRTSMWRVEDPRLNQELVLVLPRSQPADAAALDRWNDVMQRASRINHPQLASVIEIGVQDRWPYALYDPREASTVAERLPSKGLPGADAAGILVKALQGLAFAHEAGVAHHDLQPYMVLLGEGGQVRVAGLGVGAEMALRDHSGAGNGGLHAHREAAERDVLTSGLLLHLLLSGQKPLEEVDFGRAIGRLPPQGREMMRLSFTTAQPVADALRAIANRATDRQPRQRYRNARTLIQALEGWQASESGTTGGTLLQLSDRVRSSGMMPASPGSNVRAAKLVQMAQEHAGQLAELVLEDPALSFEMLRQANLASGRNRMGTAEPVLTVRRALAMLGLEGVRRAASAMRNWPGSLGDTDGTAAADLMRVAERAKRAARVAKTLRPAGYDGEVVYLIALLQNLGRLVVHYHFADEAQQIRRLMQPAPSPRPGEPDEPGMTEEGAAYAVLGTDIETMGVSVARQWGLDDAVLGMVRRLPLEGVVHSPSSDYEQLRTVASCANEAVDAMTLPAQRVATALQRVLQRYGRLLDIGPRDLQAALQSATTGADPDAPAEVSSDTTRT